MLGITNYEPRFLESTADVLELHGSRLRALIGQRFRETRVVWRLDTDRWFPNCPVVLSVGDHQLEVCAWKLSEFAISWSLIALSHPLDWYGAGDEIPLQWKKNALPPLAAAENARIEAIHIIEYHHQATVVKHNARPEMVGQPLDFGWLLHGLEFTLSTGYLTISNGLDENDVSGEVLTGDAFRKIPL